MASASPKALHHAKPRTQAKTHMRNYIKTFVADEEGAVTVDWVVLTAAIVGLGLAVMAVVKPGVNDMSK